MELRHFRYFVRVAEDLHFGRAAQALGISQPPLSQQIKALEHELGVRLFDRNSRNVTLTAAGKLFLVEAKATIANADHAVSVAKRASRGEVGELSIGFNASAPFVPRVARAIFKFRQTYPDVHLSLAEFSQNAVFPALDSGELDIGFLRSQHEPVYAASLSALRLVTERLFVAMPPDHPLATRDTLSVKDLDGQRMLFYAREVGGEFSASLIKLFRKHDVKPVIAQDVREVVTLFGLMTAGLGISVLAESLCALQSANLTYRPLSDDDAVTAVWLLYQNKTPTLLCQRFVDVIMRSDSTE